MNMDRNLICRAASALVVAAVIAGAAPALAADKAAALKNVAAAKPARGACPYGIATDGSTNCMTKADYDVARARQDALDRDPAQYMRNALSRCESLQGDDRRDCVARIEGRGTTSGSVEGGGIYRELVTREVGVAPAPASTSSTPEAAAPAGTTEVKK